MSRNNETKLNGCADNALLTCAAASLSAQLTLAFSAFGAGCAWLALLQLSSGTSYGLRANIDAALRDAHPASARLCQSHVVAGMPSTLHLTSHGICNVQEDARCPEGHPLGTSWRLASGVSSALLQAQHLH